MSYLASTPNIPSLSPTHFYPHGQQPLEDQLNDAWTDVSNIVNDKARRYNYILTEQVTNDTWVDGKAVYQKVVEIAALAAGVNNTAHGIQTLDTLVDVRVMVSNGTNQRLLGYANPTAANCAAVDVDATNIVITTGAGFGANYEGYAILFYTKV